MTKDEIKTYIKENQICLVTNSAMQFGSLICESMKHYLEYCEPENILIIPGLKGGGKPHYGLAAFIDMITILLNHQIKYAIYIDEDCFVTDFETLIKEFEKFKDSNCCLAGPQDGGVLCHRNHSHFLVNTFLSFWNIDLIAQNKRSYIEKVNHQYNYKEFIDELKKSDLFNIMNNKAEEQIKKSENYRKENYNQEVPYCDIVRNDPRNPIEPHQIPYSYSDFGDKQNFEPYYILEEGIILATNSPIYYLNANDFYDKNETKLDNSGMTSILMDSNNKIFAFHTWFSRAYNPFIKDNELVKYHTERINKIIKNI